MPMKEAWRIMMDELLFLHKTHGLSIHAFVLMGNHFHLLCHSSRGNLSEAMQRIPMVKSLNFEPHSMCMIQSPSQYQQVYRYLFQNPVRSKIVLKVEDYPFSTLVAEVPFPLHSTVPLFFGGHEGEILWLNKKCDLTDKKDE